MAYSPDGICARLRYDVVALEWRWQVEAKGSSLGEWAVDAGTSATHTGALTAAATAITARLDN